MEDRTNIRRTEVRKSENKKLQENILSSLHFVLALMSMCLVLRGVKAGYQLGDIEGKVNQLLFMDYLKFYGQNEKQIDTLVNTVRIFSEDIGIEFMINECATLIIKRVIISKSEISRMESDGPRYIGS